MPTQTNPFTNPQSRNPDPLNRPGSYGTNNNPLGRPITPPSNNTNNSSSHNSGGGGGGHHRNSGGSSTRNPVTGGGEYQLPSGVRVPANEQSRRDIINGRRDVEIALKNAKTSADFDNGGSPFSSSVGGAPNPYGAGTFLVSESESNALQSSGERKPSYVLSATDNLNAIQEGSLLGATQLSQGYSFFLPEITQGQYEFNTGQLSRTRDIYKDIVDFQSNPQDFKDAIGTSTSEGYSFELPSSYFSDKYYSAESNLAYAKSSRQSFEALPLSSQIQARAYGDIAAVSKLGISFSELGGSIGKTINYNLGLSKGTDKNIFGWQSFEYKGSGFDALKSAPSVASIYPTTKIPFVSKFTGLELPKSTGDILPYAKELGQRSEITLNLASLGFVAEGAVKGGLVARDLYKAERAAGSSRLGAIDTLGGEFLLNLSPFGLGSRGQRIFATRPMKGTLVEEGTGGFIDTLNYKPSKINSQFGTTQLNKGSTLSSTQTGQIGDLKLFEINQATSVSYTPKTISYLSMKPKLSGIDFATGSVDISQLQVVNIGKNLFAATPSLQEGVYNIYGRGQRNVFTFGKQPVQISRYELGTRNFLSKDIQNFYSIGESKLFEINGKNINFGISNTKFKSVEKYNYLGGYNSFGKDILPSFSKQGKAFGSGIRGRTSLAKGYSFDIETGRLTNEYGTLVKGSSFSKYSSGGRKGVQYFKTETYIPSNNYLRIEPTSITDTFGKQFGKQITKSSPSQFQTNVKGFTQSFQKPYSASSGFAKGFTETTKTSQFEVPKFKTDLSTSVKPSSAFRTSLSLSSLSSRNNILPSLGSINVPSFKQNILVGQSLISDPSQIIGQDNETKLVPGQLIPNIGFPGGNFNYNFGTGSPPPIPIFIPSALFPDYYPGGRKSGTRKYKRTPSLISFELGITSPKELVGETTGLIARPILTRRRKR